MIRTACVTGADQGLGLALVESLLNQGYRVFAGRYGVEDNEALMKLHPQYSDMLFTIHMDVSKDESVQSAAKWINKRSDCIDVLINNAAILGNIEQTLFDTLNYQEMLEVYNVNAIGPLRVTHALVDKILHSDSKLIMNISSEAGSIGACYRTNWFAYSMSKTALNMQTALLHNQLAPSGVQVMSVHPGWVQTHMRGELDAEATYTPMQAAGHILKLVQNAEHLRSDKPIYVDLLGNPLQW
jgi:NAD(P)-dependent dehydrogenase (short-subunit alcohol dehydrogenase family)